MDQAATNLKILLIHGLETPPDGGIKAVRLRKVFGQSNVLVPYMSLPSFKTLKNPYIVAAAGLLTACSVGSITCLWRGWQERNHGVLTKYGLLTSAQILISIFGFLYCYRKTVRLMVKHSIRVQAKAIQEFQPDVVVGSSWGGSIAIHLLERRLWQGPTLLLAPAHDLVSKKAKKIPCELPPNVPITIVHSQLDATVPISGSIRLEKELRTLATNQNSPYLLKLLKLTDDDHALNKTATEENFKDWILDTYERQRQI